MRELAEKLRVFAREREWEKFHNPKNLVMALSVEVAEIAEHFQWNTEKESLEVTSKKREEIAGEIADVLIYLVRLADVLDIDPLEAAHRKIEVNGLRYPVEKSKGKAAKYHEL